MQDPKQIELATKAVRDYADASGYGAWISDKICRDIAAAVLRAVKP